MAKSDCQGQSPTEVGGVAMQNYRRPYWEAGTSGVSPADKAKLRPILLSLTPAQTARVPCGAPRWL